jgi:hypothetical protein
MSSTQKNINARGHVAGRDITIHEAQSQFSYDGLIKRLKEELNAEKKTAENHEVLDFYGENIDREVLGLEKKLEKAHVEKDVILRAMKFKEIFSKALASRRFYKSGQIIYSELMCQLYNAFMARVVPLIDKGASLSEVRSEVALIVQGTVDKVGNNVDIISSAQIEGILYYLTGNCHIKWHKE